MDPVLPVGLRDDLAPPAPIRDLRDLMSWQYAKISADSAGVGKRQRAFVMERFKKVQSGEIA